MEREWNWTEPAYLYYQECKKCPLRSHLGSLERSLSMLTLLLPGLHIKQRARMIETFPIRAFVSWSTERVEMSKVMLRKGKVSVNWIKATCSGNSGRNLNVFPVSQRCFSAQRCIKPAARPKSNAHEEFASNRDSFSFMPGSSSWP